MYSIAPEGFSLVETRRATIDFTAYPPPARRDSEPIGLTVVELLDRGRIF